MIDRRLWSSIQYPVLTGGQPCHPTCCNKGSGVRTKWRKSRSYHRPSWLREVTVLTLWQRYENTEEAGSIFGVLSHRSSSLNYGCIHVTTCPSFCFCGYHNAFSALRQNVPECSFIQSEIKPKSMHCLLTKSPVTTEFWSGFFLLFDLSRISFSLRVGAAWFKLAGRVEKLYDNMHYGSLLKDRERYWRRADPELRRKRYW